jgi:excisionase family DNA binding protein
MHNPAEAGNHLARAQGCGGIPNQRQPAPSVWLTYAEASAYTGWSVAYLRNLVSAGQIPVYGKPRVRRFRRDMLDQFLTDPDAAMRRFRVGRNRHGS